MKKLHFSTQLRPSEITWGTRYLLFAIFFFGFLLKQLLDWLCPECPATLMTFILDTTYYGTNLLVSVFIFRHFLTEALKRVIKRLPMLLLISAIALVTYYAVVIPLDILTETIRPDHINKNTEHITNAIAINPWFSTFAIVFLVPASEEILYRGLVFGAIRKKNCILAYVISILLFAAIHVIPYLGNEPIVLSLLSFVAYVPAGLILALSYEISDNIWTPIFIHTVINTIAVLYRG